MDIFENQSATEGRPNLGLVLEFLIGLEHPGASALVAHDPMEFGDLAMTLSADRDSITLGSVQHWRRVKRKAWTVVQALFQGRIVLLDPQGLRLERSDGIGSLFAPVPEWRTGAGPAARLAVDDTLEFIKLRAREACLAGGHLPAVLAVSRDGWILASRLSDVPGANDAAKFAAVLARLPALDASLVCLMDSTGSGVNIQPLLGVVVGRRGEVLDLGAEKRTFREEAMQLMPGGENRDIGLREGVAIARARAAAFVEMARKVLVEGRA